ncbi:uncharacterized protein LOC122310183 [Carya illinoinensis]|uniref:uncharacterized protein LOC122310183 n=1 Tax=Carya illinoinensis TaxID=32201 RepID=UPI001C7184D2|nr:uncharacterized protein LOC122310183 [Carya illinoinensis]
MKFPTDSGVGESRGEQALAQECYVVTKQNKAFTPPLAPPLEVTLEKDVEVRDDQSQQHAKVNEPLELVTLYIDRPRTTTCIGTQFPPVDKEALKQLLIEHNDVFAWSHDEMPGIDNHVIEHCLSVDPAYKIRMHAAYEEKTSFITDQELYCYQVMPFGLKNVGETYQRLVNRMFKERIRKSMEVYMDDLLIKSKELALHLDDLRTAFRILRHYKMRLNPTKCAFGVQSGKFFGFIMSERGIEAFPKKIEATLNMKPSRSLNET